METKTYIKNLDQEKKVNLSIPATRPSSKARIKKSNPLNRNDIGDYVTKPCDEIITEGFWVEVLIGYDTKIKGKGMMPTTLNGKTFIDTKGNEKFLYEFSEIVKYFYDWGFISEEELSAIKTFLLNISDDDYYDKKTKPSIIHNTKNNEYSLVSPISIPYNNNDFIIKVMTEKQQRSSGNQPMLYLYFPITKLEKSDEIIGRKVMSKERFILTFDINEKNLLLEMLKAFGSLTPKHNKDIINIIDLILGWKT